MVLIISMFFIAMTSPLDLRNMQQSIPLCFWLFGLSYFQFFVDVKLEIHWSGFPFFNHSLRHYVHQFHWEILKVHNY